MGRVIEIGVGVLAMAAMLYLGWRALLLGAWLRRKVHGEPDPPTSLFGDKKNSN
jgi:hypothetical protein